jgi:hypothetical protein
MADVEARGLAAVAFVREAVDVETTGRDCNGGSGAKGTSGRDPAEVDPADLAEVEEGVGVMEDADNRQEHHLQVLRHLQVHHHLQDGHARSFSCIRSRYPRTKA